LFPALSLSLSNEDFFLVLIFQYFFGGFDLSGEFLMLFKLPTQEPTFKNSNLNFTV
jgi:hypothetical protein